MASPDKTPKPGENANKLGSTLGNAANNVPVVNNAQEKIDEGKREIKAGVDTVEAVGAAAAGNWVSYSATVIDIALYGSPVLILWAAAVIIERRLQPANDHSIPSPIKYSALSAVFYIVCAAAYILLTRFPS